MRRMLVVLTALALAIALPGVAAADHEPPSFATSNPEMTALSGGEGASWNFLASFHTGNPHTDLDFFTQQGETYVSAGTLSRGANGGGQTIFQLTDEAGEVVPSFVSSHPSAACPNTDVAGLQHDVEATPKGNVPFNTTYGSAAARGDAQLLIDATDAPGRCHDNGGGAGSSAPPGGLEIVDITDVSTPEEIALISEIGESHTVNVDPKRPHIAYSVPSDFVGFEGNQRTNESEDGSPSAMDGFEVIDLSSCMYFPDDATTQQKRGVDDQGNFVEGEGCRPEVYRYRWEDVDDYLGHTLKTDIAACHELEVYPDDRLVCGGGPATGILDMSGAFDDDGTPNYFLDDKPRGEPLPCRVRASTSGAEFTTGAPVIDCVNGQENEQGEPVDLRIPNWLEIGAPSLEGVEHLGAAHHIGGILPSSAPPPVGSGVPPPSEDISFSHEGELTHSQNFMLASDERGGGLTPPDAACPTPMQQPPDGNGGVHAYAVDRLDTTVPPEPVDEQDNYDPDGEAYDPYARTPEGDKAIYRVTPRVPAEALCTAHVFHQIPGQNRIFMGWYSQGTNVVDMVEHTDGTFEFKEAGFFIPTNASTWTSAVFKFQRNEDGSFTYFGATGDFALSNFGRNAVDIYSVTLPPPPEPAEPPTACALDEVPASAFTDIAGSVHKASIECIAWYEITEGVTAENYAPGDNVTRAQMASFLARLAVEAGVELPDNPSDAFTDDDNSVHQNAINVLAELDIVSGVGGGEYDPTGNVTRAQMASFVANVHEAATGSLPAAPPDVFDDDSGSIHHDSINALAALAAVRGSRDASDVDGDGDTIEPVFLPAREMGRAPMATFIANELRVLVDSGEAAGGGARITLDGDTTTAGGDLTGTVAPNKPLQSLTANRCGLDAQDVSVADDGSFTVTIGSDQSGDCRLTLTATTKRQGADTDGQPMHETFDITIESGGGDGNGGGQAAGGLFATW